MKRNIYIMVLAFIGLGSISFRKDDEPKKIAFIVAIGTYPEAEHKWDNLSSMNDDTIISIALKKQGFETFFHIQNEKATLKGIREGFKTLLATVKKGDVVYVHFSSHGQQIADDRNRDEVDGLDEAIVCYDAKMTSEGGYAGQNHLRDDELGIWMNKLRKAAGPTGDVLVVMDACHSGTALRGENKIRGGAGALIPTGSVATNNEIGTDAGAVDGFSINTAEMSPLVLFSAARAHEPNSEYGGFGSLSLALSQNLQKLKSGDSYRTLFSYISTQMSAWHLGQVPVLEGKVDRNIFGGAAVAQSNYYTVKNILTSSMTLESGTLSGLYPGTKIAVMPAGSLKFDASKALYQGEISAADPKSAYVRIPESANLKRFGPRQVWIFVTEQNFGGVMLKVGAHETLGNRKNDVKERSKMLPYIQWVEKGADILVGQDNGSLKLYTSQGIETSESIAHIDNLNIALNNYMQGKLMTEANYNDPNIKVELEFLPVVVMDGKVIDSVSIESKKVNGTVELEEGDYVLLILKNTGKKAAYVNILDIQPDGKINNILPDYADNENGSTYLLKPGQTYVVRHRAIHISRPYGKEIFKVFATDVPVDLLRVSQTRGDKTVKFEHPVAKMFQASFNASTRGGEGVPVAASGGGTTFSYNFIIKTKTGI